MSSLAVFIIEFSCLSVVIITGKFSSDIFSSNQTVSVPFNTEVKITGLSELECTAKCAAKIKCNIAVIHEETSLMCNLLLKGKTDGATLNQTFEDPDQAVIWVRQEQPNLTSKDESTTTTVAMVTCPSGFRNTSQGCYYVENAAAGSWDDAREACDGIDARLATPDSPEVGQGSKVKTVP